MSVFLTPSLRPIFAGTYFPLEGRFGMPSFKTVLSRIAELWRERSAELEEGGERLLSALRRSLQEEEEERDKEGAKPLTEPQDEAAKLAAREAARLDALRTNPPLPALFQALELRYDESWGGFGHEPKFPTPVQLQALFRIVDRGQHSTEASERQRGERAREMCLHTLRRMAQGGIRDHLGGGFHRYSTTRDWHIPHYEKMTYDQAQIAQLYLLAYQLTGEEEFAAVARQTLDYLLREMRDEKGGFYSAEDADSEPPASRHKGLPAAAAAAQQTAERKATACGKLEGAFYVWEEEEVRQVIGDQRAADLLCFAYDIRPEGNTPKSKDPHGELAGQNTLTLRRNAEEIEEHLGIGKEESARILAECRAKLFEARKARPRPHRDDKVISAWNGLAIAALAEAAAVLREPRYLKVAEEAAAFLQEELFDEQKQRLLRYWRSGVASPVQAFAGDYAAVIYGLLGLFQASGNTRWLSWAVQLQDKMDELFWDRFLGGYFNTTGEDGSVLIRTKDEQDGAEPSPNSLAALNLTVLYWLTHAPRFESRLRWLLSAFQPLLSKHPIALPLMSCAVDALTRPPAVIVIVGQKGAEDRAGLEGVVHTKFCPNKVLLPIDPTDGAATHTLLKLAPELRRTLPPDMMRPDAAKPAKAFVCANMTCQAPVTTGEALSKLL